MRYEIAVVSGKGGTGKTTVTLALAKLLGEDHVFTLVDADVEEPNDHLFLSGLNHEKSREVKRLVPEIDVEQCTFCRRCQDFCEFNAITLIPPASAIISDELCHSCGACSYACQDDAISEKAYGIGSLSEGMMNAEGTFLQGKLNVGLPLQTPLIRELKNETSARDGIVLIDAPPGTSCPVVASLDGVDLAVLVAEPTPFGVNDMNLAIDTIQQANIPFVVVINKAGSGNEDIYRVLKDKESHILAEIPFSMDIARQYAGGALPEHLIQPYLTNLKTYIEEAYQWKSQS